MVLAISHSGLHHRPLDNELPLSYCTFFSQSRQRTTGGKYLVITTISSSGLDFSQNRHLKTISSGAATLVPRFFTDLAGILF